jgi:ribonuclease R
MVELCLLLRAQRRQRGSVDLSSPETMILVNNQGVPTGLEVVEYDISHQLVEEFMLKANEIVATHLSKENKALAYRIHDKPDEDSITEFVRLAKAFGYRLPAIPNPLELQAFFEEIQQTPYYNFMVAHYIKSMKLAIYSPHNIGHFGLSLENYCHFTSPIRRYADLVVHRILFGEESDIHLLEEITDLASEKERISAKAESSVTLLKKLRHIASVFEKDPETPFPAIVTRIKPFGFVFELIGYEIEGFINLSDVESDYYIHNEGNETLVGRRTGAIFSIGKQIQVFLKSNNLILMEAKWGLVEEATPRTPKKQVKEKKFDKEKHFAKKKPNRRKRK